MPSKNTKTSKRAAGGGVVLKVKRLHPAAVIPHYNYPGDAGMDLYVPERVTLLPGERKSVPLGIALEIPDGHVGLLWDKSGLSHTHGIKTFGGVIDAGYRGEIHAGVMNLSDRSYIFEKGHKIVQLLVQKIERPDILLSKNLSKTTRGDRGFSSTGR